MTFAFLIGDNAVTYTPTDKPQYALAVAAHTQLATGDITGNLIDYLGCDDSDSSVQLMKGTSSAMTDCLRTVDEEAQTTVENVQLTLKLVNKLGEVVLSKKFGMEQPNLIDNLPIDWQSPMARNYQFFATQAEAQINSGTALIAVTDVTGSTIYVGYDVNTENSILPRGNVYYTIANMVYPEKFPVYDSTLGRLNTTTDFDRSNYKNYCLQFNGGEFFDPYNVTIYAAMLSNTLLAGELEKMNSSHSRSPYYTVDSSSDLSGYCYKWMILNNPYYQTQEDLYRLRSVMPESDKNFLMLFNTHWNDVYYAINTSHYSLPFSDTQWDSNVRNYKFHQIIPIHICNSNNELVMEKGYLEGDLDLSAGLPDELRRGFCQYTYYLSESDMLAGTNGISGGNGSTALSFFTLHKDAEIWVKYTTNIPFKTLSSISEVNTSDETQWYAIKEPVRNRYVRHQSGNNNMNSDTGCIYPTGNSYHFTFIGDPYELKIVCRDAASVTVHAQNGWENDADHVLKVANDSEMDEWAISPYTDGGRFRLFVNKEETYDSPYYVYSTGGQLNTKSNQTPTNANQLLEVGRVYIFHIINKKGTESVKFSRIIRLEERSKTLAELLLTEQADYRSPLATNYKFYSGEGAQARASANSATSDYTTGADLLDNVYDIYVGYDAVTDNPVLMLDESKDYYIIGVTGNGYLSYNTEKGNFSLVKLTDDNKDLRLPYSVWKFDGRYSETDAVDPYQVKIVSSVNDKWIGMPKNKLTSGDNNARPLVSESAYYERFMILNDPVNRAPYRIMMVAPDQELHYSLYLRVSDWYGETIRRDEGDNESDDAVARRSMRIIPFDGYVYHVINLSGEEAITAKAEHPSTSLPHEAFTPEIPEVIKAYGLPLLGTIPDFESTNSKHYGGKYGYGYGSRKDKG